MRSITNSDEFIELSTGNYPIYLHQIAAAIPGMCIPVGVGEEAMYNSGYALVRETPRPEGDVVQKGTPIINSEGAYEQTWIVRAFTEQELQKQLDLKRSQLHSTVYNIRSMAYDNGAVIDFGVVHGVQHVGLQTSNRIDIEKMRKRAERFIADNNPGATMVIRTKESKSIVMVANDMVRLCDLVDAAYEEIWTNACQLLDAIDAATTLEELPQIPDDIFATQQTV